MSSYHYVALKYSNASVSEGSHFVTSEVKQDSVQAAGVVTSSVDLLFLHIIGEVTKLLQTNNASTV